MPRKSSAHWDRLEREARPLWAVWWLCPGDEAVRAKLVEHYAPLACRTAWARATRSNQLDRIVDQHDLSQELVMVLMELIERYDPEAHPGIPFHKYAAPRLAKRVFDVQRDADFVGRWGRLHGATATFVSIDKPIPRCGTDQAPATLAELLPAGVSAAEHAAYQAHILSQLHDDADRRFARMRWFEGKSIGQIGALLKRSEGWAFIAQARLLPQMLRAMGLPELIGRKPGKRMPGPRPPAPPQTSERNAA